ncbi:DoxX family protein [Salirhabdus sp. Marseille-P4669]|uniref:DoxX family protein n=1 Tax=Salirhabdus sp. Marseille-P4669 TaxID=2042310 RepID=UPI000C7BCC95|nr:DoxX family protein [Salirhabdus sp. Marseille-P4669]
MYTSVQTLRFIRYVVAYVFIVSGIMKVLSSEVANHFMGLGLPLPQQTLYVIAFLEVGCGLLLLTNRYVKYATIPLMIIMIGAILFTKVPILHSGFLQFAFQARLDIVLLVLLFILLNKSH